MNCLNLRIVLSFMKLNHLALLFLCCSFFTLSAQTYSIKGVVVNDKGEAIPKANIELLKARDSSLVTVLPTNAAGEFVLGGLNKGFYKLVVTYVGYEKNSQLVKLFADITLDKIVLLPAIEILQGGKIVKAAPPATQKGDTSEYKASAFKTNPDASAEDLVNKMPGVTNTNGKVQVQGEDLKTVLVDGKPYFGDDPSAVLKNLPADAIDKVQVFDAKSAQSQFTGFDDGNTSKTINIITKAQYKNGVFGKVYGGYGYDNKWRGGASVNFFKNERKISVLFNSNNINEQNFSADDLLGVMSATGNTQGGGQRGGGAPNGGGNRGVGMGGPQNSSDNFLTNSQNGIVTTQAFGLNYTNKWKKLEFTGSYFFNYSSSSTISNLYRTYITRQEGLLYNQSSIALNKNTNQRFNLRFDWKIDSFNSILFQPKFSSQFNNSNQNIQGSNTQKEVPISNLTNSYISDQNGFNFSSPILYRHSFKRKGRTLSVNATPGYSQSAGNNKIYSLNRFQDTLSNDTLNQLTNLTKNGITMSSNITYTEPLSKYSQLMINYTGNLNINHSDKQTNQFNTKENAYKTFDTLLSNTFKSQYISHGAGISYNYRKEKLNYNFGANYQIAQLNIHRTFPVTFNASKPFVNVLPTAMLQYRYTQQKNIRIFYRTNTNAPSIDQLQDIINNANPLQLSTGNNRLKQDFQQSLNVRYSSANTKKSTSYFGFIGSTVTQNYIANSTFIAKTDTLLNNSILLSKGSQLSKPVNLNGYYNFRSFTNYSFVIKKIKSNVNLNAYGSVVRTPSMINDAINYSQSNNVGGGFSLASNISKNIDFTVSSNTSFSTISNTLQKQLNSQYLNQNSKFKIQAMPWKGLVLQTDISHQYYKGLSQSVNTNYALWNAGIGYKFLKDRSAEFRLVVFDLLKQNTSVSRNTTETYYEDVKTTILQRFFMFNFTYNIKYFKDKSLPAKKDAGTSGTTPATNK